MELSVLALLGARVERAAAAAFGPAVAVPDPAVLPTRDPRHGDYQASAPLVLAKHLRRKPLDLAAELVAALDVADVCEPPEVAPPGFVNLRLRPGWLAQQVAAGVGDERLGVAPAPDPMKVVVDYSSPNLAKEMHVGHLRTTVIGDCLANVAHFLGHEVERVSHVGDYGTQFGMLVAHLEDAHPEVLAGADVPLSDLVALYQEANERFRADVAFRQRARQRVVDLQAGEPSARGGWQAIVELSRRENAKVYDLLDVHGLIERGESYYEPMLPDVVADLDRQGLLTVDQGAKVVYVPGFTNKEGEPLPLIVQKQDGGYNYATTDLAAVRHRVQHGAREVLYVVDAGQSQHLEMVFAVARTAGWAGPDVVLRHVPFGLVLGEGGKKLRTRSGEPIRLLELLVEAVDRARAFLEERAAERGTPLPDDADQVARVIGIGAVKYADLSQSRTSNYVFSFEKMLTLKGNTAPYLQYAYARIRSILREAGWAHALPAAVEVHLGHDEEVALAKHLVRVGDVLARVAADDAPNHLCAHLYDLSGAFNAFYERCPVLRSDEPVRTSRLALCEATARTLRVGLGLLGIRVLERI